MKRRRVGLGAKWLCRVVKSVVPRARQVATDVAMIALNGNGKHGTMAANRLEKPALMISQIVRANPYGWIVVAVTFLVLGLVLTARTALGLLIPEWEAEFGWDRTFLSSGGAIMLVVIAAGAPLAGLLIDRLGSRVVYVVALIVIGAAMAATAAMTAAWQFLWIYCVIAGVGFSAISAPMIATTIALYFEQHRGLATGIATSGATGGVMLLMPLLAIGVETVGWRASFIVMGVGCLGLAILTWLLVKREGSHRRDAPSRSVRLSSDLAGILTSRTFWLLFVGFVICGFTTTGIIELHLLPYAAACGFPPLTGATAYGVLAAFNMIGMVMAGYLADRVHRPILLASIYFFRGLSFILLFYIVGNTPMLFIFAVMFGVFDYSTVPITASLVASHIGLRVMGLSMGILMAGHSLGAAVAAFLGGYLFDLFASYDWVWILAIVTAVSAAFICLTIPERRGPVAREAAVFT